MNVYQWSCCSGGIIQYYVVALYCRVANSNVHRFGRVLFIKTNCILWSFLACLAFPMHINIIYAFKYFYGFYCRSEERISELSKEITDIKVSKRQTADEKLQGFQAENASLKSALSKATTRYDMIIIPVMCCWINDLRVWHDHISENRTNVKLGFSFLKRLYGIYINTCLFCLYILKYVKIISCTIFFKTARVFYLPTRYFVLDNNTFAVS